MSEETNLKTLLVMVVILLWFGCTIAAGEVIYVDADASTGGDGTTWGTAYKYLQDALYEPATGGDEIWVAAGTYYPDEDEGANVTPNDRTETFQLISVVEIYGGFAGYWAAEPNERDIELYETILSGDINTPGDNSDNSYHVVTGSGTDPNAVLDGFTITTGNANGSEPCDRGGGMYNYSGSPTIINCTFAGNSADYGGGMFNNEVSSPAVTNCTFSGNSASYSGGGMFNLFGSPPTVSNCTFSGNSASYGGGMCNYIESSPTVTNCTFSGNSAEYSGGMLNHYNSSPTLTNCTFSGNSASYGGGMYNNESNPPLTNCTFSGNSASQGGGMVNKSSSPTLSNCILWGDTASDGNEIALYGSSIINVNYCDVEGGQAAIYNDGTSSIIWGDGNIEDDPLFIGPNGLDGIPGTADDEEDNVHLRGYSPCINAGDLGGDYIGQVDIDGQPRVAYGRVDMGADEVFPIAGDFEPDGDVDFYDFGYFANNWLLGK